MLINNKFSEQEMGKTLLSTLTMENAFREMEEKRDTNLALYECSLKTFWK